jgi:hypothetical protein
MTVEEIDRAIAIEEAIIAELERINNRGGTWENAINRRNALASVKAGLKTAQGEW